MRHEPEKFKASVLPEKMFLPLCAPASDYQLQRYNFTLIVETQLLQQRWKCL